MAIQWTCPYCNRACTIDDKDIRQLSSWNSIPTHGNFQSTTTIIVCPNPDCRKLKVVLEIQKLNAYAHPTNPPKILFTWDLLPESEAKPFPDYIPKPILDDYQEACLIKTKSPKASATLSRRCLQGMIRDFWKIKKHRLIDEIVELQEKIDGGTWEAIDSVRKVGNIGAHMEKDVDLIVDVEPQEAGLLIWLIETLLQDWYITRHEKTQRMAKLVEVAKQKKPVKPNQE